MERVGSGAGGLGVVEAAAAAVAVGSGVGGEGVVVTPAAVVADVAVLSAPVVTAVVVPPVLTPVPPVLSPAWAAKQDNVSLQVRVSERQVSNVGLPREQPRRGNTETRVQTITYASQLIVLCARAVFLINRHTRRTDACS